MSRSIIDERADQPHYGRSGPSYTNSMVVVAPLIWQRILHYVQSAKGEIGGFARVEWVKRRIPGVSDRATTDFHITEAVILPQYATSGYCHIHDDAMAAFVHSKQKRGEDVSEWSCWWHSHSDFNVFMSGIDRGTLKALSQNTPIIGLCFNRYGQVHGEYHHGYFDEQIAVTTRPLDMKSPLRRRAVIEVRRMVSDYQPERESLRVVEIKSRAPIITDGERTREYGLIEAPEWEKRMIRDYELSQETEEERELRAINDSLNKGREANADRADRTEQTADDGSAADGANGLYAPGRFSEQHCLAKDGNDTHRSWRGRFFRRLNTWKNGRWDNNPF